MPTCPHCNAPNEIDASHCSLCASPLIRPTAQDAGSPPPPPPRACTPAYIRQQYLWNNVHMLLGTLFVSMSAVASLPVIFDPPDGATSEFFWTLGSLLALFALIGVFVGRTGWKKAKINIDALQRGLATQGQILKVVHDRGIKKNRKSPWKVEYNFEVADHIYKGQVHTWDDKVKDWQVGQPTHVLYLEENPKQNTIYPPIR